MADFAVHDVEEVRYEIVDLTGCIVLRMDIKTKRGFDRLTLFSKEEKSLKPKQVDEL